MAATGLHGPYSLTEDVIDEIVRGVGPGAYVLTRRETKPSFIVNYVGRSDGDLSARLKQWVGSKYSHFKYGFLDNAKAAFLKECQIFHDFGGIESLDNKVHPARVENTNWTCLVEGCDALR